MIDYASRQRTPRKHLIGLTVVVVLHGLLFWAINSGLARKFVKVIKGPVEAVLLEFIFIFFIGSSKKSFSYQFC